MTRPLRPQEWAAANLAPGMYPIRAAGVVFQGDRFSLPGEMRVPDSIVGALVMPVYDEADYVCDLAAYVPTTGQLANWNGCGWALGQTDFPAPLCILHDNQAVTIYRDPLAWIRADRRGLVVLDIATARWRFAREGLPLIANAGVAHARDLDRLVAVRAPTILLPRSSTRSAA